MTLARPPRPPRRPADGRRAHGRADAAAARRRLRRRRSPSGGRWPTPATRARRTTSAPASPTASASRATRRSPLKWLTLAAEAGDPVGCRNLATLYFRGEGVARGPRPRRRALPPGRRGRRRRGAGHAELDAARRRGDRRPTPPRRAAWPRAAAAQGNAASMTRLGMMLPQRHRRRARPGRGRALVGARPPRAATPTPRRCSARPAHSARASRATRSRPSSGCCAPRPAAARSPSRFLRAAEDALPLRRRPAAPAAPPTPLPEPAP